MANFKNMLPSTKGWLWFGSPNVPNILAGDEAKKNLSKSILPIHLQRIRQDALSWRTAMEEAERPFNPFRVQQQQIYIDVILDGHVKSCLERRKDLTLLRDWQLVDSKGNLLEDATKSLDTVWFNRFISHALDALFFGYSLIELGDITDGKFKGLKVTKRWNVSPDRYVVSNMAYNLSGTPFLEEPYKDWHVYVSTPNDIGTSDCGYGILYEVGLYQIMLRNLLGYNGDFVELFAQPLRVGRTNKTEEAERGMFEEALANMGSSPYILLDAIDDEVEFIEAKNSGTAWRSYDNLETRLQKIISKIILGHADAMDSTAGKLGATQGKESPTFQSLEDKQSKDGYFVTDIINTELLPRLRKLGFAISEDAKFEFKNDHEVHENSDRVINQAVQMYSAGLQMDVEYFEEQTGIKVQEAIEPKEDIEPKEKMSVKDKLKNIYK